MNNIFVINLIYLLVFLARPTALNHSENESFYKLIIPKIPVDPCLKLVLISVNSWFNQNMKTKPIQSQNKAKQSQFFGGFWRKNFNFSLKIDDTKLNLLCKTKPIYKNLILSMSFQKTLNMQNEPNLFLSSTNKVGAEAL